MQMFRMFCSVFIRVGLAAVNISVQTFHCQTFNHPALITIELGLGLENATLYDVRVWVRVINSSPLAMSSCYKV